MLPQRHIFPLFLLASLALSALSLPAMAQTSETDTKEKVGTAPVAANDPLPEMAEIEQAWARSDFVTVRIGLERLAKETGSALAQYRYGRILLEGRGGPRDATAAMEWLQKAADQKHAAAEVLLAKTYLSASVDSPQYQPARAARLFASAAARGTAEAQHYLGLLLREGIGVKADLELAFNWFLAAAEQNYVAAQYELSRAYSRGEGIPEDTAAALHWLNEAAVNGHVQAQFFLAHALDTGQGVRQNQVEAVSWLHRAAEAGFAPAQRALGRKYLLGDGADTNPQEALRWLTEAAEQKDYVAMTLLGDAFSGGHGLPIDPDLAWNWYRKGSEHNYGRATAEVATMLEHGIGRDADLEAAVALYRKSLEQQNYEGAALELGRLAGAGLLEGLAAPHVTVPWAVEAALQDDKAALDWLRQQAEGGLRPAQTAFAIWLSEVEAEPTAAAPFFEAAAQRGDVKAQYRFALMLSRGNGVAQDYVAAHTWLNIAAASGHSEAGGMRATLSELMTADEIAEAQARARAFFEAVANTVPVGDSQ